MKSNDLFDLLAVLLIGGMGMFLSFLEVSDPVLHVLRLAVLLPIIVYSVLKCIGAFLDIIDRFKAIILF